MKDSAKGLLAAGRTHRRKGEAARAIRFNDLGAALNGQRQPRAGDWSSVMSAVAGKLRGLE